MSKFRFDLDEKDLVTLEQYAETVPAEAPITVSAGSVQRVIAERARLLTVLGCYERVDELHFRQAHGENVGQELTGALLEKQAARQVYLEIKSGQA